MEPALIYELIVMLAAAGMLSGLLAGLLGVGGGIVLVPVLDFALHRGGFPAEWCLHVAVATSLASIVPTSIVSSRAHHARGAIDAPLAAAWAPGMVLGGLAGSLLAARVADGLLATLFGVVAALAAVTMFLPLDRLRLSDRVPRGLTGTLLAAAIGSVSAMMGIGGGTLAVPTMSLTGAPIHTAVGTAAFFGLLLAVPGTLAYLFATSAPSLPVMTVGLVSGAALLVVTPLAMLTAPLGARLAHALPRRTLTRVFGVFLCLVALRMAQRALT